MACKAPEPTSLTAALAGWIWLAHAAPLRRRHEGEPRPLNVRLHLQRHQIIDPVTLKISP